MVRAVSIQPQALPSCTVDQLGALDYLFVGFKKPLRAYFPQWRLPRAALLAHLPWRSDHLDDMHQAKNP